MAILTNFPSSKSQRKLVAVLRIYGLSLFLLLALFASGADAQTRGGLFVPVRESESPNAKVIGQIELYKESYALVIGIDNYTGGWPRLSNAVKDAKLVAAALEAKGFVVERLYNPDAVGLEKALKEFFVVKGEDADARLFVWFAGHGHTELGEGFLVPADAPRPSVESRFRLMALPLRRLGEWVRLARSKHTFAVFDSCFAGTIFGSARSLPSPAVTRATSLPVRQFLTSGEAGQEVADDGRFRELFIRSINGEERADANRDGYLTASELGLFISDRVTNLTQSLQTPRYGKLRDQSYDRGDFVFALPNVETATVSFAGKIVGPSSGAGAHTTETIFWQSVANKNSPEFLEAYLQQYPSGKFAALAKANLSVLKLKEQQAALPKVPEPADVRQEAGTQAREAEAPREREKSLPPAATQLANVPPAVAGPAPAGDVAQHRGPPVGSVVAFDNWGYRVEEESGLELVIRTRANNYRTFLGVVGIEGEHLYSDFEQTANVGGKSLQPATLTLKDSGRRNIANFWPLQIGKNVQFGADEEAYDDFSGYTKIGWTFTSTVSGRDTVKIGDSVLTTFRIETEATATDGRTYKQLQWYHPASGIVVKMQRNWAGKSVGYALSGRRPGDVQSYELRTVSFPDGDHRGLREILSPGGVVNHR